MGKQVNFNIGGIMSQDNQVKQIPVELFRVNRNHMFTPYDEERRKDMAESIRKHGVMSPAIVRPYEENGITVYELLAGFNRLQGSKDAGKATCPAIIKENLTDEEAMVYMIESNLIQRGFHDLKLTERAAVVALRYSEMFTEEKLTEIRRELLELKNSPMGNEDKGKSKMETVGGEYGLSKNSIARLIRVNTLSDKLKPYVDNGVIALRAAVNLSYLTADEQKNLPAAIDEWGMDIKRSEILVSCSKEGKLTDNMIRIIMSGKPPKETAPKEKPITVKIQPESFKRFFDEGTSKDEIADTIEKALEMYFSKGAAS